MKKRFSGRMFADTRLHMQRLLNFSQDLFFNIETHGTFSVDRPGAVYYATVNYTEIRDVLRRLDLQPSDTFVDVGAGKGRVLCLAALHRVRRVIGVECSPELADLARHNISRMRGKRTQVDVQAKAAEEFDYSAATVLYFFNPFEADVLDLVLQKINADRAGKAVRLVFVMESAEQRAVFLSHRWLECRDRWVDRSGHVNTLYRTV